MRMKLVLICSPGARQLILCPVVHPLLSNLISRPPVKILLTVPGGTSFVYLLCSFCLVFAMSLCASVYLCLVVTCWERADFLAIVCGV